MLTSFTIQATLSPLTDQQAGKYPLGPAPQISRRSLGPSTDYAPLAPLIGGTANLAIVEENWDEMLRLWASIAAGLVPPSVILKKITAAPKCTRQGAAGDRPHRTLNLYL
jgi:hypothetical protein